MVPLAAADAPPAPVQTPTQVDPDVDVRRRLLPPYKVILHNDDHTPIPHVVKALRKSVPGMSLGRATAIMWEAHTSGRAIVITCPLELAELYQQRLLSFGLTATIEKDE
ncbi:MAG: ATP-dependent Clp protease adaptor ClpS [Chloroflexota bacterium]